MEQETSKENLSKAIQFAKAGNKQEAGEILIGLVHNEPNNEVAWLWLSSCYDNLNKKLYSLQKVLEINPNNEKAKIAYQKLQATMSEPDLEEILGITALREENKSSEHRNQKQNKNKSIEFISASCPDCGGELRVPSDRKSAKCIYCGHDVMIHDPNKFDVNLELKVDINKLFRLAQVAEKGRNYVEGTKYYSQILEHDSENISAWFGKARCVGWIGTVINQTLDEATSYVKIGLEFGKGRTGELDNTLWHLSSAAADFSRKVIEFLAEENDRKLNLQYPNPLHQPAKNQAAVGLARNLNQKFLSEYFPKIFRTLTFCWSISQSENIGRDIYNSISNIRSLSFLDYYSSRYVDKNFNPIVSEINQKFPNLPLPKKWKKCYIATAIMGDIDHPYVETIRNFRDLALSNNFLGKIFINFYYHVSPFFAEIIARNEYLKRITKIILIRPLYKLAKYSLRKQDYS
jgi:rRNA maturation protein Nop10